jgi:hypothetical protein
VGGLTLKKQYSLSWQLPGRAYNKKAACRGTEPSGQVKNGRKVQKRIKSAQSGLKQGNSFFPQKYLETCK